MEAVPDTGVNDHYLDNVIKVSQVQNVEASEDIFAGNGMKLLSRGARIDGNVKERLLDHKLRKPLEECLRVSDGVTAERVAQTADALLEKHAMLRALYANSRHKSPQLLLKGLDKNMAMQSLLTVYAQHREHKLEHAVGVSLLAMGIAKKLTAYDDEAPTVMLMAGLFHDVGELYIAPAFLARDVKLTPQQWRHVAVHPVVSHRVLKAMPGFPRAAAQRVLDHHERLDGYGYPHGAQADKIALDSQILAVAELLAGLMERSGAPLAHADVALRLIPGEFTRGVIDLVSCARHACSTEADAMAQSPSFDESLSQVRCIATVVQRLAQVQAGLAAELAQASGTFKALLAQAMERLHAIRRAFSSTGMDTHDPEELLARLAALGDAGVRLEFNLVLKEIRWRLNELERELTVRVQALVPQESALMGKLTDVLAVA